MNMYERDEFFVNMFLWSPSVIYLIIFLYRIYTKESIGMAEWQTLLGAFVGAIIAGGIAIWKENKNSKGIIEKVKERHTLAKAQEYHELTMKELDKEFEFNKERILDAKNDIKDISTSIGGISTNIQIITKNIENHVLNLKEVRVQEPTFMEALKIFEGCIQKLGEAERKIQKLEKEKEELIVKLDKQLKLNDELEEELSNVRKEFNNNFTL